MTELVDIKSIIPNPNNPRIIEDDKFLKLVKSLQEFPEMLQIRPIVVNDQMVVLGGNMRLRALKKAGIKKVPIIKASLSEDKQREFIIKDNIGFGEWDWSMISNEWDAEKLTDWGLDIPGFETGQEAVEDDYMIPDEIETDIVLGDLFEIGQHRLLCGDSTDADDVGKLIGIGKPNLMVTDPPYGVNYDPQWRNDHNIKSGVGANRATGKVQNDEIINWEASYSLFNGDIAYVWHGGKYSAEVSHNLQNCGFLIINQIIWAKQNLVMSRGDYHWQHEPCWYAVRKGKKHNWAGDRKQTTLWQISNNNPFGNRDKEHQTGHGTQKPVECMARPIKNNTYEMESVYDPFIGSGTTMVAAHQLNRKCYGMEIDPKYCEIILQRMLKLDPSITILKNGIQYATTPAIT